MAKNDKSTAVQSSRDASSNPEILRDRINELMTHLEIAQRQCIESRDKIAEQQKQFSAMEAHIGSLCKQRDHPRAARFFRRRCRTDEGDARHHEVGERAAQ